MLNKNLRDLSGELDETKSELTPIQKPQVQQTVPKRTNFFIKQGGVKFSPK